MALYSYHVFMFPFQWEHDSCKGKPFNERFNLNKVSVPNDSMWENLPAPIMDQYETELYNEKNFFYKFVHNVLYDNGKTEQAIVRHFERKEAYSKELTYEIGIQAHKVDLYELKIKSIGIDLFSTGTGILIFYLENHKYKDIIDVKRINQFGRRVFPPYMAAKDGVVGTKQSELADFISIKGLSRGPAPYFEDFTHFKTTDYWKPARFIESLIKDLDQNILVEPVVDDRMFTMCWFFNNKTCETIKNDESYKAFVSSNDWHEYLYIDSNGSTCQNQLMQKTLLEEHTYSRWQKEGTIYGVTRFSFMAISDEGLFAQNVLLTYFRTMYVRMVELVLVQRSSILKFSSEVTTLSTLSDNNPQRLADNIGKFYQAYIRFVNQVYFREITAQEQGIELYEMLQQSLHLKDHVKDLDEEIGELHNYATLLDDKRQNQNLSLLTKIGALFIAPSLIASYFGMNILKINGDDNIKYSLVWVLGSFTLLSGLILTLTMRPGRNIKNLLYVMIAIVIIATFLLPFFLSLSSK